MLAGGNISAATIRANRNYGSWSVRRLAGIIGIGLKTPMLNSLIVTREPYVRISFHNTIGQAVAPIIVDQQVLAEISSHQVIIKDQFDEEWHRHYAHEHHIPWRDYAAGIKRSPHMSLEQLEGAATLMGMIANTIANLAHRNLKLETRTGWRSQRRSGSTCR